MLSLVLLLIALYFTLQLSSVQTWVINRVAGRLSERLHTTVSIQHIDIGFFDKMELNGLLIKDQQKDTLLYAGTASVKITDWFFFKDKPVLKYVALKDATINMKRTDSVWNFQFIADYFAGPQSDTTEKSGFQFDLKVVELQNIKFNKTDAWVGKDVTIAVKKLNLAAEEINFAQKKINISLLDIDEPLYVERFYDGKRPENNIVNAISPIKDSSKNNTNTSWVININSLHLNNGTFGSGDRDASPSTAGLFDGSNMYFSSITGDLKNVKMEEDTLTTDVSLSAKERSGLEVKKIAAKFKFTPQLMEFDGLDLVLNKSRLTNYYAMHFKNFKEDMGSFLHNVKLDANFANSEVSSDDIAFFSTALKNWKRNFKLNGAFKGSVDNFTAKKMSIRSGNSVINGNLEMVGLPDIDNTFIDLKSDNFQSSYTDIVSIIPSLKKIEQPQLSKLGNIQFKGNFTGFIKDFVAFGTINTNLGTITSDLNLKLPGTKPAVYIGNISTKNFQLGKFINSSSIGAISFSGKMNGTGFTADDVSTNFDGTVSQLECAGYNYQNIIVKGDFKKRLFNGTVSINDPNLKLDNLTGTINLSGKEPKFDFDATLSTANLKELKLTEDNYALSGHFNLNFSGSNIDNFTGTATVNNAAVLHNGTPLPFDSLTLRSEIVNDEKVLTVQSNEVEATINGKFKILELPDAFSIFLSHYYPAYIKKPSYKVDNQDFCFQIKTHDFSDYTRLMDKKLEGFDNATISGSLELEKSNLSIMASIPQFKYDGKVFNDIRLESIGSLDTLVTKVNTGDIAINDSLRLPSTNLTISSHNDVSDISIKTSASKTLSNASLNAQVQTMSDGVKIHFFPSSFIINDKEWQLEKNGELLLSKSMATASNIKFTQGNQQINISTQHSATGNGNDVIVDLQKVSIGDIAPFVVTSPKLEGLLTGNLKIVDPFGKPTIDYDLKEEEFRLDGDSIGTLSSKGNYSDTSGIIKFNVVSNNPASKININGSVNLNDTTANQINISFMTEKFDLNILNNYLGSVFTDFRGMANTSDLHISGNGKHRFVTGTAYIDSGSVRVNYTQCRYTFNNATVIFNPDEIDLGTIKLKDSLNNNATVTGKLYHNFFQDFEFDNVRFESNKLLVLNTTKKDNNLFYGKVIGSAAMALNGPLTNMIMRIDGETSSVDSSHIVLSSGNSVESGTIDYIDFKQFGNKMEEGYKGSKTSNIFVDMHVSANPACKIDVILDESTGDIVKGEGYCNNLNITVGTNQKLNIRGRYDITSGEYTFNFQKLLKKPFGLNSGSITWDGDPYNANINIVAEYFAKNVDFSTLASSINSLSKNNTSQKSDVYLRAYLTQTLNKPKIKFEFQLPDYSPSSVKNDFVITKRLEELKTDENEMNKQVTSLLLFNSFINNSQSFLSASSGYSVLSGTIGGVISNTVSGFFNNILQKYLKNTSFYFNSNSSMSSSEVQNKLEGALASGLVFNLANGRLIITAGVDLDYNDPYILSTTNNNLFVTPDVTAEWLLTADGSVRIVGFNKTSIDINGQRNSSGTKLTYRKESDTFLPFIGNFFHNLFHKKKKDNAVAVKEPAEKL